MACRAAERLPVCVPLPSLPADARRRRRRAPAPRMGDINIAAMERERDGVSAQTLVELLQADEPADRAGREISLVLTCGQGASAARRLQVLTDARVRVTVRKNRAGSCSTARHKTALQG